MKGLLLSALAAIGGLILFVSVLRMSARRGPEPHVQAPPIVARVEAPPVPPVQDFEEIAAVQPRPPVVEPEVAQ